MSDVVGVEGFVKFDSGKAGRSGHLSISVAAPRHAKKVEDPAKNTNTKKTIGMADYDSDSSNEGEEYTETNVLLGYATQDATGDAVSHLGGVPV